MAMGKPGLTREGKPGPWAWAWGFGVVSAFPPAHSPGPVLVPHTQSWSLTTSVDYHQEMQLAPAAITLLGAWQRPLVVVTSALTATLFAQPSFTHF